PAITTLPKLARVCRGSQVFSGRACWHGCVELARLPGRDGRRDAIKCHHPRGVRVGVFRTVASPPLCEPASAWRRAGRALAAPRSLRQCERTDAKQLRALETSAFFRS